MAIRNEPISAIDGLSKSNDRQSMMDLSGMPVLTIMA